MTAMFEFAGKGLGVMPDPADNPAGHVVPHSEAGLQITFEVRQRRGRVGPGARRRGRGRRIPRRVVVRTACPGGVERRPHRPGAPEARRARDPHLRQSRAGARDNETNAIDLP